MKSIKKFFMLGALAAMTAFCLAPGFALADEGGQALEFDSDGVCTITKSGTYYLADDTTGRVVAGDDGKFSNVTINLNGHTLTNTTDGKSAMSFATVSTVTINGASSDGKKLGSIVQNCSGGAIRYDSSNPNAKFTLNDAKVTAQDNQCLQFINGKGELNNVDMSTEGGDSVIYVNNPGVAVSLTINSGTFTAGDATKSLFKIKDGCYITLKGGSFNRIPDGESVESDGKVVAPLIAGSFAMFKAADSSSYVVESASEVKAKSVAKVVLDEHRAVYFDSEKEAEACAADNEGAKLVKCVKATVGAPENCVYNGEAKQAQVKLEGVASGADVKPVVEYKKDREKVDEAKDAGSYTATVTGLEGDDAADYELASEQSADFEITKAEANIKVTTPIEKTLGDASFNLNAKADTDAKLEYASDNKSVATVDENGQVTILAAGTTVLTVSADEVGNYKESEAQIELRVKAPETNLAKATVTLSKTAFTYNGKAQKPSVKSVVLGGKTLKAGTDYTASVASGKKVGTYAVTVTAKGSYTGKATTSFVVNPKGVTKFKVTKAKKSFKAKWKKAKAQRSGVQLRYSTKKSMANAKTVKAKGAAAKAKTVKKLKVKKKYYVQARTYKVVNGKTYYSGWSAKKAVKTK